LEGIVEKRNLHDLRSTFYKSLEKKFGARAQIVEIPREVHDSPISTKPTYVKGSTDLAQEPLVKTEDDLHMNMKYGDLLLCRLLNDVSQFFGFKKTSRLDIYLSQLTKPAIIIGGCARSGTTLLLSILSASPEVLGIYGETCVFCSRAKTSDSVEPFPLNALYSRLLDETLKCGHRRWIEKTPRNILFFDRILDYFGEIKLIQIVRDGRDVILSRHPANPDKYWVSPNRWINDVAAGVKYLNDERIYTLRYEDLILDYESTMADLVKYLDLPLDNYLQNWHQFAEMRSSGAWFSQEVRDLDSCSIGKWKEAEDQELLEQFLRNDKAVELLTTYGYIS